MLPGKNPQIGKAGHGAILLHHLADDGCRVGAAHAGQIHRRFSMAGAAQHPALLGDKREDMAGPAEVLGP
ncbi:hypothetical protein D3C75_878390 [compost metagenome]